METESNKRFEAFFAAVMAHVERRTGLDTTSKKFHVLLNAEDLKGVLRGAWTLAYGLGAGEEE